jgi:hypothetical protein
MKEQLYGWQLTGRGVEEGQRALVCSTAAIFTTVADSCRLSLLMLLPPLPRVDRYARGEGGTRLSEPFSLSDANAGRSCGTGNNTNNQAARVSTATYITFSVQWINMRPPRSGLASNLI